MLWIPKRKIISTIRRRLRSLIRLLLFLSVFFGLGSASAPSEQALLVQVQRVTSPYRFDFIDWESQAITGEIKRRWTPPALPGDEAEQRTLVETFLAQEQRRNELQGELSEMYAVCPNPALDACPAQTRSRLTALEQELAQVSAAQAGITAPVETILSRQIEAVLRDEGFTLAGHVFPPVAFRFIDPPTALILSPRDRIENQHFVGLQPGLENNQRARIENALDRRGDVSSYVTDIGGLASYPTMVISHTWLVHLIEIIAHEWTHNYLYTFPTNIAWGYQTYPRLTTINETTADLVGQEVSRRVITRFYPHWVDRLPPLDDTGQPVPGEPSEFDTAMRRIRQQVDALLAEGKITEAEVFMETERLKLVAQGYHLRKLNQAYFAFHGSYALSPASIDPTGPQLRRLRAASLSLKAFLNRVGWLNSYDDFLAWLDETGAE